MPDALRRAVVDGNEHGDLPVLCAVKAAVMSVPHIASILSGMIVPSWVRGPRRRPTRVAADRAFSRIRRRTRSFEVRRPRWRSRAQTLR